jgi:transcription-repair coupling factor (superfamily II helicase)
VQDLAANMLETQALRQTLPGHAFSSDTAWQEAFEATFPYQETQDQVSAIEAVKEAMEQNEPMDHLVCGDVGYGKTEVAMRAAFKAVMDGKQVAVLVPTTILAQQHFQTFRERMAAFPITVEMLSRFRSKGRQQHIIEQLREGSVDIIIGTHRLVQDDVGFKDLGLVVIDEEQRFGVAAKEKLKGFSQLVDILTLTATPIPRTLYLSLTGARHMSVISTPPMARLPIQTTVAPYSNEKVRAAILMELNREGQVFYLHNRVKSIANLSAKLKKLVPEARIEFAHGQMSERELERTVQRFIDGKFDVLLCTTIIESGVDIPNVNTIIIDRADRFGLAELYQLRGRVGRDKHQAYAYLLLPEAGPLRFDAKSRVQAMQKYSSLGAGFKLALRDLETRGAGNLLGSEQSGHITAVGFDLYCQLLDRTVRQLNKKPVPLIVDVDVKLDFIDLSPNAPDNENAAMLPISYMEDEKMRVELYRRISGLTVLADLDRLKKELQDRFGRAPIPVRNLLKISEIRIRAAGHRISEVEVRSQKLMLKRGAIYVMINKRFPLLPENPPGKMLDAILAFIKNKVPEL